MARVAVVSGTATAVSNRVSRRQASRWGYNDAPYEEAPPPQAPPPQPVAAAPADDPITRLQELGELKSQGLLTEEEFAAAKAKVLAG